MLSDGKERPGFALSASEGAITSDPQLMELQPGAKGDAMETKIRILKPCEGSLDGINVTAFAPGEEVTCATANARWLAGYFISAEFAEIAAEAPQPQETPAAEPDPDPEPAPAPADATPEPVAIDPPLDKQRPPPKRWKRKK